MFPTTVSYMKPSERVRQQWQAFENWVETVPRVAMEKEILDTFQTMDAKWHATSSRMRISKPDHEKSKAAFRRELEDGLVTLAREEWQRRLQGAGLRDEDWGEMTFKETLAAERLLGGDLDEEGMAIMENIARAEDAEANATVLPTTSFSGYSFVSPMSLSIVDDLDDDDGDAFESIFPFEIAAASSAPESVADEIFDAPTSTPWGWNSDASSSYGIWSADTSQSSRQNSQTGSPERPPLKAMSSEHTFFPRAAEPLPQFQSTAARVAGPRYIGPHLADPDETREDEADFERFKMATRVAKIREFHEAAANADIQLAQDIYDARRATTTSRTWRADEERKVAEHERCMVLLRRTKEDERKEIVRAERQKRREVIRLRQLRTAPPPTAVAGAGWGGAESPRQRLTQEVESKLKSGGGFAPPEPIVPTAETRRERRTSHSTISASQPPLNRTRQAPVPEPDRLAASVSDLFEMSASTSTAPASSQIPSTRQQVWVSSADALKPLVSTTTASSSQPRLARNMRHELDASVSDLLETASSVSTSSAVSSARPQVWVSSADPVNPVVPAPAIQASQRFARSARHELDASVSDLLETASSVSTSSAASSTARPQVWLPAADVVKPTTKAGRKKAGPPVDIVAAPFASAAKQQQPSVKPVQAPSTEVPPSKPSSAVDTRLPSPPKLVPPTPPKLVVSSKSQPPSKGSSPPAPVPSKASSPPTKTKVQPPLAATKAPSPPSATKVPSPPAPTKAPSPPTAIKVPSPSAPTKAQPPAADTTKPTTAPNLPQKNPRVQNPVLEIQTPGASSSRTTLEQMQRPFIHRSLGTGQLWEQPMAAPPPSRNVWVSSSSSAAAKKPVSASSAAAQIAKAASMAPPRLPPVADTIRARRMSDPVSPSPRSFAFPNGVHAEPPPAPKASAPSTISAKGKGKSKRVTMEEVSDEEDADAMERLPVDSKVIFEPKPSVPAAQFSQIFDFAPDVSPAPAVPPVLSQGGNLTAEGKSAKEKHVRWTPSALGDAPASSVAETVVPAPPSAAKKGRSRAGSLLQTSTADRKGKGKGKERAVQPEVEDDEFAQFMLGATQNLTQMRG